MAKKSYSENITSARVMIDGLKAHAAKLPAGIDSAFIDKLEATKNKAEVLNSEQEKLKADLKTKTEALEAELQSLQTQYAEAKKRVKLDIAQSQWREFGIEDKK